MGRFKPALYNMGVQRNGRGAKPRFPDEVVVEVLLRTLAGHDPHRIANDLETPLGWTQAVAARRERVGVRLAERYSEEELAAEVAKRA